MGSNELALRLQKFAESNLIHTSYGSECDNYQEQQLQKAIDEFQALSAQDPEIASKIVNMTLIPAMDSIGLTKMANIGVSATRCLSDVDKNSYLCDPENEKLKGIIKTYLKAVAEQAQEACQKDAEAKRTEEAIEKTVARLLGEHIKDLQVTQERFQKFLKEAKDRAAEADKTSTAAASAAVSAITASNKAKMAATSATKKAKKAEQTADNMIPNMLTVLGIFVGIIIAVVACYLSVLLVYKNGNIIDKPLPVEFLRYWVMGHITLMSIFLLLYLVSKLTSRCVATRCGKFEPAQQNRSKESGPEAKRTECYNCAHRCSAPVRFRLRYAYMFVINILFVVGYVILGVWQMINVYYRREFDQMMEAITLPGALAIVSIILIAVIAIACWWLRVRKKGVKKTLNESKTKT